MFKIETVFYEDREILHPEIIAMELDKKYKECKIAPKDQFEQRFEIFCEDVANKFKVAVTFKGETAVFHDKSIKV